MKPKDGRTEIGLDLGDQVMLLVLQARTTGASGGTTRWSSMTADESSSRWRGAIISFTPTSTPRPHGLMKAVGPSVTSSHARDKRR